MPDLPSHLLFVLAVLWPAGLVEGVIGPGPPTVAMGLLGLVMAPAQAAALLVGPPLVTNVWQSLAGPRIGALTRRLWAMLLGVCAGTWAGSGVLTGGAGGWAVAALGATLVLHALMGLLHVRPRARAGRRPGGAIGGRGDGAGDGGDGRCSSSRPCPTWARWGWGGTIRCRRWA